LAHQAFGPASLARSVFASPGRSLMAQAILLKDVDTLGERGDVIDVSPGYLRNYLLPRKLAHPATTASIAEAERRREVAERAASEQAERAEETAVLLRKTVLTIQHQAGEDGRLFGSVTNQDLAESIKEARGIDVDRRKIHLEDPIKNVGTYQVVVEVAEGVTATVKVMVTEA
jgi:large subunit ribosomal protein L9